MKKWLETAVSIYKIANSDNLEAKKSLCLEIFGSNLILKNKKARMRVLEPQFSPQKNRWVLLRKTVISQTKQALTRPNLQLCPILVEFYNQVRTELEREGWSVSSAPTPAGVKRPLAPPEKPFAYFFISPRRISFLKLKRVFSGGRVHAVSVV